jgi:hypothetical protein
MQNQKSLVVAILVIGLFIVAGFFISKGMDKTLEEVVVVQTGTDQTPTGQTLTQTQRETIVTTYIKAKISQLSPELPVLGGTFYVTDISFTGPSQGEVKYEDGHVAFVADFSYSVDEDIVSQGEAAVTVKLTNVRDQ